MTDELVPVAVPVLSRGPFVVTRTGLQLEREPSFEEWQDLFDALNGVEDAYRFAIGDALNKVEAQYGETASQLTAMYPDHEYDSLRNYRWTASKVEFATRVASLTWSHHREIAKKEPEEQAEWLTKAAENNWTVAQLRQEMKRPSPPKPVPEQKLLELGLHHADFRTFDIPDNSIDIIFTDPPYDEDSVGLYGDLARKAKRWLRPGGLCLAYSGQYFLPRVYSSMSSNLDYLWTTAIRHTGGELRFRKYRIHNGWKPIAMFGKPPVEAWWEWFTDITTGGKEKADHEWQQAQAEAEHYLKFLCPPEGVVLDPMCGSGTTLIAARSLGLNYIGIDIDEAALATAAERLEDDETEE